MVYFVLLFQLSTHSEVGPSGEESYRLSFNHSFSLPHRKPSGRVKRGMVEVQPKEPMTPPGEVAGISFAPQNDWSEPEELFRPYRRPRQMSGRHPVGLEGGGTILKGGVLGRSHRNQYTSKVRTRSKQSHTAPHRKRKQDLNHLHFKAVMAHTCFEFL